MSPAVSVSLAKTIADASTDLVPLSVEVYPRSVSVVYKSGFQGVISVPVWSVHGGCSVHFYNVGSGLGLPFTSLTVPFAGTRSFPSGAAALTWNGLLSVRSSREARAYPLAVFAY